jgi:probable phosphoglycerate mutase
VGRAIAGRAPGVHLDEGGRAQAQALARVLVPAAFAAIVSSPLERARETAAPLAAALGLTPEVDERFTELDYGQWTGKSFDELDGDPDWRRWNTMRGSARIPGGESALEAQARALAGLEALRARHPDGRVAVVSHADVIRAVLAHCLATPLDLSLRIEVAPASVSAVTIGDGWVSVHHVNQTPTEVQ